MAAEFLLSYTASEIDEKLAKVDELSQGGGANVLASKKLSIIGDSISTYDGYIPSDYSTWYPKWGVDSVEKTWWYQLIQNTGMVLCKNASYSGSTICGSTTDTTGSVGCSDDRIAAVAGDDTPDIIIVFIGINDFAKSNGYSCGTYDGSTAVTTDTTISEITEAYGRLISKLRITYPDALICCCRIMPEQYTGGSMDSSFSNGFPNINPDDNISLPTLNEYIEKVCKAFGCGIIPMDASGISFYNVSNYTGDGLHPNEIQMERMALIAEEWLSKYATAYYGDAHTHSYTSVITTAATCTMTGVKTYTCSCGDSYTEPIAATGHSYVDGVCSVCGTVDPNYGSDETSTLVYNWDLTSSLTDTIGGVTATLAGDATQDENGLTISSTDGSCYFGNSVFTTGRTIEVDVASTDCQNNGINGFFIMIKTGTTTTNSAGKAGLTFRTTGRWEIYHDAWFTPDVTISDGNAISGKTVRFVSNSANSFTVYFGDTVLGTADLAGAHYRELQIGSSSNEYSQENSYYHLVVTAVRVYEAES